MAATPESSQVKMAAHPESAPDMAATPVSSPVPVIVPSLLLLTKAVASSPSPYPISPSWLLLSRLVISISETLLALLSKRKGIMDLINWSLNAIDTIFSTRSLGSGEPNCPAGTFASGYVMDGWEKWRVVCLAALSLEDVEDIYLFGTLITGFLLMGIGGALGYRRLVKAVSAAQNPTKLAGWIETVVGRAVSTQTVVMDRKMENIMEKLAALQRILDKPETSDGQ
ncbi:hypothetical protein QQF64_023228 [Cirrhinus molitorella]|uniref:Uncharacterized protein n=2 Tax=Cirrhinus molitorella TaxID=172907 RepID=A0ABR3L4W9_9TELE